MKTETLYEFLVLSKTLNYSKAAENLYISQSVLSKHIQEMEKELGTKLLFRSTHEVSLTQAGMILAQKQRSLLNSAIQLHDVFKRKSLLQLVRFTLHVPWNLPTLHTLRFLSVNLWNITLIFKYFFRPCQKERLQKSPAPLSTTSSLPLVSIHLQAQIFICICFAIMEPMLRFHLDTVSPQSH